MVKVADLVDYVPSGVLLNPASAAPITNIEFYKRKLSHLKRYTIPIYSGIIGVLIPEKKLIPLNLMPLELEFSMNPYALYCLLPGGGAV